MYSKIIEKALLKAPVYSKIIEKALLLGYLLCRRSKYRFTSNRFNLFEFFVFRDGFHESKNLENTAAIEAELGRARISLEMLRRQATVGQLFDPHVNLPLK